MAGTFKTKGIGNKGLVPVNGVRYCYPKKVSDSTAQQVDFMLSDFGSVYKNTSKRDKYLTEPDDERLFKKLTI